MSTHLTPTIASSYLSTPQWQGLHAYRYFTPDMFDARGFQSRLHSQVNLATVWNDKVAGALRSPVRAVLDEPSAYAVLQFDLGLLGQAYAENSPFGNFFLNTLALLRLLEESNDGRIAFVFDNKGRNYVTGLYMDACHTGALELNDRSVISRHYSRQRLMESVDPLPFPDTSGP